MHGSDQTLIQLGGARIHPKTHGIRFSSLPSEQPKPPCQVLRLSALDPRRKFEIIRPTRTSVRLGEQIRRPTKARIAANPVLFCEVHKSQPILGERIGIDQEFIIQDTREINCKLARNTSGVGSTCPRCRNLAQWQAYWMPMR